MKTGMDKVTFMPSVKFHRKETRGYAVGSGRRRSKGLIGHPYMREGFVFACCQKKNCNH